MGSLNTHSKSTKLIPMIRLTATLYVTLAVILGSVGVRKYNARKIYFYVTVLGTHIFYPLRDRLLDPALAIRFSSKPVFILVVFQLMRLTSHQMCFGSVFSFCPDPAFIRN